MEKHTPFKELSKDDKLAYIWDYWKFPIIATLILVIAASSIIKTVITNKDPNLAVLMINSHSKDVLLFEETLSNYSDENYVLLNANLEFNDNGSPVGSYMDETVLSAQLNSETFDLFFGNGEKFLFCADEGFLIDLRSVLPEETLSSVPEDHILYSTVGERTDAFPCAILLDNCEKLNSYYPEEPAYCGIIYNSPNPENAANVLTDLLFK